MANVMMVLLIVLVVGLVVYFCSNNKSGFKKATQKDLEKETFVAAGALDNVGSLLDSSYDLIQGVDDQVPAYHFADLVDSGDLGKTAQQLSQQSHDTVRPMERLQQVQGKSLMPRLSNAVTPYAAELAQPTSSSYMVNFPRVILKNPLYSSDLSTSIRGDVPINVHPNISLVATSRFGRDSLRQDALFSPGFNALYNKYSLKSFANIPQVLAGAGTASNGGSGVELIMDNY